MISIDKLLDMIYTEGIPGAGIPDHYFDEARNKDFIPPEEKTQLRKPSTLPPIQFNLELTETSDGKYEWVE